MKHVIGLNAVVGAWLILAAFASGDNGVTTATWNDVIVGLIVVSCSVCLATDAAARSAYMSCAILSGAWLMIAPFAWNYRSTMLRKDIFVGALVIAVAVVEIWRVSNQPATSQQGRSPSADRITSIAKRRRIAGRPDNWESVLGDNHRKAVSRRPAVGRNHN